MGRGAGRRLAMNEVTMLRAQSNRRVVGRDLPSDNLRAI